MSDHPNTQDSIKQAIARLDEQIKYEEWHEHLMNLIQNHYPIAWAHLEQGTEPADLFQLPRLDEPFKIARKASTEAAGFVFEDPDDGHLPRRTADDGDFRFDHQDDNFFYAMVRNQQYLGNPGQKIWEMECANIIRLKSEYLNKTKPQVWADMERFLSDTILSKVKIPLDEYKRHKAVLDYLWLDEKIKSVHTGEGTASISLKLSEVLNMRFQDLDLNTYNSRMINAREDLTKMNIDTDALMDHLFSVNYHIGLSRFANSNPAVDRMLQSIYESHSWPTMDVTMSKLNTSTTLRKVIQQQNNTFGILRANESKLQANMAKPKPSNHGRTAHYKGPNVGGTDTKYKTLKVRCLGCGGWHSITDCEQEVQTCGVCAKNHCTDMHEAYVECQQCFKAERSGGKLTYKDLFKGLQDAKLEVDEEAQAEESQEEDAKLEAFNARMNSVQSLWEDYEDDYYESP